MDYNTEGANFKILFKETKPYFLLDTAHTTLIKHLNETSNSILFFNNNRIVVQMKWVHVHDQSKIRF